MEKVIITHNGVFHADEVLAIALYKLFIGGSFLAMGGSFLVIRDNHNYLRELLKNNPDHDDVFIDVGFVYDKSGKRFDHHQDKNSPSAASLVWEYIKECKKVDNSYINELVRLVSNNDVGKEIAPSFTYPDIIAKLNCVNPYSPEQNEKFNSALDLTYNMLDNIISKAELRAKHISDVENATVVDGLMVLPCHNYAWKELVNGSTRKDVEWVTWWDEPSRQQYIQVVPMDVDSYEFFGRTLPQDDEMKFVHANGFLATGIDLNAIKEYLNRHFLTNN